MEFIEDVEKLLSLTIKADDLSIPIGLTEDNLFELLRPELVKLLENENITVYDFGLAPDNTADSNDDLLYEGTLFRIICDDKLVGLKLNSKTDRIYTKFKEILTSNLKPWTTIIIERGFIRQQKTIELLYRT